MKIRQTNERKRPIPAADMARRPEEIPMFFDAPAFFKRHKEEIWLGKAKELLPEAVESLKESDPESATDLARGILLANGVLTGLRLLVDPRILFAESAQLQAFAQLPDRSVA